MGKLKLIIAKFLLLFVKSRNVGRVSVSSNFISESERIMIIDSESDSDIKFINSILTELSLQKKEITIVLAAKKLNQILQSSAIKYITYNQIDKSFLNFPKVNLVNDFIGLDYDIIIDLNKDENIFALFFIKKLKSNYQIGFDKNNADQYYNFQIASETISENSEKNLLNCLKMF